MSLDRRTRIVAARDRFVAESATGPVLRLLAEQEGIAFDLSRMADGESGAGERGRRVLGSIAAALGAPEPTPFVLAIAGDASPIANALAAIAYAVRSERIETGLDDLAVAYPWLTGRMVDGTPVRAPLFLYPATLSETQKGPWAWTLEIGGAPWLNEPLVALFRRLTRVRLSYEDFLAHDEDGLFKCDAQTWQGFIRTLQRGGITLAKTDQDLPPRPEPFEPMDDAKFERFPPGQFRLQHQLVLGRFPMLSAGTAADYEALLQTSLDDYSLAAGAALFDVDPDRPGVFGRAPGRTQNDPGLFGSLRRWQVLPTDPFQDDALRTAEELLDDSDRGLVVLGATGTGRSQLITNLVAGAIQHGHRVLVTSPRRAALDDVAMRLDEVGLSEPVALVHDPWRDRNALCHAIAASADPILNSSDVPPSIAPDERQLNELERQLGARLDEADEAFDAITQPENGRPSLAALDEAWLAESFAGLPDVTELVARVSPQELDATLPHIDKLAPEAARFIAPHPLSHRSDWGGYARDDVARFYEDVQAARVAIERWARLRGTLPAPDLDHHRQLLQVDARPIVQLAIDDDPAALRRHAEVMAWLDGPLPSPVHAHLVEELREALGTLAPVPAELVDLPSKELAERIQSLDKLQKMEASGLRHFSPAFWSLKSLPQKIGAALPADAPKEPEALATLHREAVKWQHAMALLPDEPPFALSSVGDPEALAQVVARLDFAFDVCRAEQAISDALGPLGLPARPDWVAWARVEPTLSRRGSPFLTALAAEYARAVALDNVEAALAALGAALSPATVTELSGLARDRPAAAEGRLASLAATSKDAGRVAALDQRLSRLPPFVGRFLRLWAGTPEEAAAACRRAVQEGWRRHRLGTRSATALDAMLVNPRELRALKDLVKKLGEQRVRVALGRWRDRTHEHAEHDGRRQELLKLVNETGRRRLRATLKQIVERYWKRGGMTMMRPVWLAPLDAVASIFPRDREAFDLVIIDEAHRASLGAAVPALLRSRRVIVLGDNAQAPPRVPRTVDAGDARAYDSYRPLLPLACGVWEQTGLWWAWGARREQLWTFPNACAYDGSVLVAPNAEKRTAGASERIRFIKVEGQWLDGVNKAEARRVVDIIEEVFADRIGDAVPSIGVVAFTPAQATLIHRYLDRRAARKESLREALRRDRERPESEQLVVGDLQQVLVDTRDVIIMSLTYATTETSRRLETDFAQLAEAHGESFITGVITRARVGLHVVASFHAVALDAARQPGRGPKVLEAFMMFVEGTTLGDERMVQAAMQRVAAITGMEPLPIEAPSGMGLTVRRLVAEPLAARGLGVSFEPLAGPVAPDMTVAPTPKSAPVVAIQTTRFLQEPDALVRDLWARQFWQRQGWTLVRVTPGVWRAAAASVIRSLEKVFSLPPLADEKLMAAVEKRQQEEQRAAELARQRMEEELRWAAEAEAEAQARWAANEAAAEQARMRPPRVEVEPEAEPEAIEEEEEIPRVEELAVKPRAPAEEGVEVEEPTVEEVVEPTVEEVVEPTVEEVVEPTVEEIEEPTAEEVDQLDQVEEPRDTAAVAPPRPVSIPLPPPRPAIKRPPSRPATAVSKPVPRPAPAPVPAPVPAPAPVPTPALAPVPMPPPRTPTAPRMPRPPTNPAAVARPPSASVPRPPSATAIPLPPKSAIPKPPKPAPIPRPGSVTTDD